MATIEEKVIEWETELSSILSGCNQKITNKGGTAAATLKGLENAIETISAGASLLPSNIDSIQTGTITPEEDIINLYVVEHGMGVVPNVFIVFPCGDFAFADNKGYLFYQITLLKQYTANNATSVSPGMNYIIYISSTGTFSSFTYVGNDGFTDTTATIMSSGASSTSRKLKKGTTYGWIALKINNLD